MTPHDRDVTSPDYEPAAINVRVPVFLAIGLAALVACTFGGLRLLDRIWSGPASNQEAATPVDQPPRELLRSDAPLSAQQRQQRLDYEAQQEAWLSSYGWIDRDAGVVRIPIARAMELLQQREATEP